MKKRTSKQFDFHVTSFFERAKSVDGTSMNKIPIVFVIPMPIQTWTNHIKSSTDENRELYNGKDYFHKSRIALTDASLPHKLLKTRALLVEKGISWGQINLRRDRYGHPVIRINAFVLDAYPEEERLEHYVDLYSKSYAPAYGVSWSDLYRDLKEIGILEEFWQQMVSYNYAVDRARSRDEVERNVPLIVF